MPAPLDGKGALQWLAGEEPLPPGAPGGRRSPPWPALAAYVQAPDPEAGEIVDWDGSLEILLHGKKDLREGEMLQIDPKVQYIHQAQLHERHVAVAQALLQDEGQAS